MNHFKQWTNIKFHHQLEKLAMETLQMLQMVYGKQITSWSMVFKWHHRFKDCCESVETTHTADGL
jgi:hypothetical protein